MLRIFRKERKNALPKGNEKMSKSSSWRYLKYAIGEILLVVLGILIALQINNWNENRKLLQDLNLLEESLISELEKDCQLIAKELVLVKKDLVKLENYFERISSPALTKDTLIKIYNIEFDPIIYGAIKFNNSTLNSLTASSMLSKLDKEFQDDLFKISEIKENYFATLSDIANYVDVVTLNGAKYPRSIEPLKRDSKLNRAIWDSLEFAEIGAYMNNVFGVKYVTTKQAQKALEKIYAASMGLLQKLK